MSKLLPFFAYGTLLPGQPNYYIWRDGVKSIHKATLQNGRLYNLGYYPMLVEEGSDVVFGALVAIHPEHYEQVLRKVDELEGYDPDTPETSEYRRQARDVMLEDGNIEEAWVYIGDEKFVKNARRIDNNDWLTFVAQDKSHIFMWWRDVKSVKGLHESE